MVDSLADEPYKLVIMLIIHFLSFYILLNKDYNLKEKLVEILPTALLPFISYSIDKRWLQTDISVFNLHQSHLRDCFHKYERCLGTNL